MIPGKSSFSRFTTSVSRLRTPKSRLRFEPSGFYDNVVRNFPGSGTDDVAFIYFRVDKDEQDRWAFAGGDLLVPEWTNPDSGNMRWALEVGLSLID